LDSIRKVFAYRMKEARGDRTQEVFAERMGVSVRTYQEWEAGNVPQKATLAAIVEKLSLPSETMLFRDPDFGKPSPSEALAVISNIFSILGPEVLDALASADDAKKAHCRSALEALLLPVDRLFKKPTELQEKKPKRSS
jgi:transcriptional regulator with XRE-family HTH domain